MKYSVPNGLDTLQQHEVYTHRDLPRLERGEVLTDRERLRIHLLFDKKPDPWLLERWRALDQRLAQRP